MSEPPNSIIRQVSPEYKAKCIEWALRTVPGAEAVKVIEAAKAFYEYVYAPDS